jgi:hypothetical protein
VTYQPPQPNPVAYPAPARVEAVPGTPFGLAIPAGTPITSGLATGALVAGVGSIVVSLAVGCFGLVGARDGWGPWASGAFAILSGLLGIAGIAVGIVARRQTRRAAALRGKGMALTGIICGATGLALTVAAVLVALLLTYSAPTQ